MSTVAWRQLVLHLGELDPVVVEEIFLRCGASSVTLMDAGDDPVLEPGPGETPLWADTTITGLFTPDINLTLLVEGLVSECGLDTQPRFRIDDLEDRDWEREWLKDFGPMQFGRRLWIYPTHTEAADDGATIVRLDPGLAFGTGTHATTALCLEWLDGVMLADKDLLDYGCGSGILAIAGLKLGCRSATAMDIDPQAVVATRQNAADNDVAADLQVLAAASDIADEFDVVVANILAGPLVQFAESITLTLRQRGMLALSGVLCEQADEVMTAYERWITFEDPVFREQDGQVWSRLTGQRRTDAQPQASD